MSRATRAGIGALSVLTALATGGPAAAQVGTRRPPARLEVRADYLGPRPHAAHAGLGVNVPAGAYVRLALVGAGGVSWRETRTAASARADVIARFAFDPFRERRWGLSAGGGLSARYDGDTFDGRKRWRALIALVLDLEGPPAGAVAPAVQVGLGGGLRAGLILRGAGRDRR